MAVMADEVAVRPAQEPALRVGVTLEVLLYCVLAIFSLALRTARLDAAPLNDPEAHQALAALRAVNPNVPGDDLTADSPLTFFLHVITFTFMPASSGAARLPVALGGVLLTLTPLLWRRCLTPLGALAASVLLLISPVELLASRTSSPVIWGVLLAAVGARLALRFHETRRREYGIAATMAGGALIFLAGPTGFLTFFLLAFGVIFAWLTEDDAEDRVAAALRDLRGSWPWAHGLLAAALLVILVGTVFFWLPAGLTAVGSALWAGLQGFTRSPDDAPLAFPLWIALRYEPGLVLFGLIGASHALRFGGFFERALAGWAIAGLAAVLFYAGADASSALWLVLPLSVLVAQMIARWLTERPSIVWRVPAWGVGLHAVITLALWFAVGMSVILLGKLLLLDVPMGVSDLGTLLRKLAEGIFSRSSVNPQVTQVQGVTLYAYVLGFIQLRLLITVLVTLLIFVLFFLVGSLWGARTAWRGLALGSLAYLLLTGLGAGGHASFDRYGDPRELWYLNPVTDDVRELRTTLREMSLRATGEPNLLDITAMVPQDGALAWALRDYRHTVFVEGVGPEVTSGAVVMPEFVPPLRMGADYVGKDLIVREQWDFATLSWKDSLMWLYRSDSQVKPVPGDVLMLWVRKDIYGVEQVTEE